MKTGSGDGACIGGSDEMLKIDDKVGSGVIANGWQSRSSAKSGGMYIIEEDDVLSYDGKMTGCDELLDDEDGDEHSISSKGGCGRASTSNDRVV